VIDDDQHELLRNYKDRMTHLKKKSISRFKAKMNSFMQSEVAEQVTSPIMPN